MKKNILLLSTSVVFILVCSPVRAMMMEEDDGSDPSAAVHLPSISGSHDKGVDGSDPSPGVHSPSISGSHDKGSVKKVRKHKHQEAWERKKTDIKADMMWLASERDLVERVTDDIRSGKSISELKGYLDGLEKENQISHQEVSEGMEQFLKEKESKKEAKELVREYQKKWESLEENLKKAKERVDQFEKLSKEEQQRFQETLKREKEAEEALEKSTPSKREGSPSWVKKSYSVEDIEKKYERAYANYSQADPTEQFRHIQYFRWLLKDIEKAKETNPGNAKLLEIEEKAKRCIPTNNQSEEEKFQTHWQHKKGLLIVETIRLQGLRNPVERVREGILLGESISKLREYLDELEKKNEVSLQKELEGAVPFLKEKGLKTAVVKVVTEYQEERKSLKEKCKKAKEEIDRFESLSKEEQQKLQEPFKRQEEAEEAEENLKKSTPSNTNIDKKLQKAWEDKETKIQHASGLILNRGTPPDEWVRKNLTSGKSMDSLRSDLRESEKEDEGSHQEVLKGIDRFEGINGAIQTKKDYMNVYNGLVKKYKAAYKILDDAELEQQERNQAFRESQEQKAAEEALKEAEEALKEKKPWYRKLFSGVGRVRTFMLSCFGYF